MSKATRQLHISEDVFSGYNHTVGSATDNHPPKKIVASSFVGVKPFILPMSK